MQTQTQAGALPDARLMRTQRRGRIPSGSYGAAGRPVGIAVALCLLAAAAKVPARQALFDPQAATGVWTQFDSSGYKRPVCGVVYTLNHTVVNGVALGGVGTGCLDLESDGTLGYSTIFNSYSPRRRVDLPFAALSVGDQTWILAKPKPVVPRLVPNANWLATDLGTNQPAWTAVLTHLPGWCRSIGKAPALDFPQGRVGCHSQAVLRWTSPVSGTIQLSGGLWPMRKSDRTVKWSLRHNATTLTDGSVVWGSTSAQPLSLATGSGGEAALKMEVLQGDLIELQLGPGTPAEDFVGVDFKVTAGADSRVWDVAADWSDTANPNGAWTYDAGSANSGGIRGMDQHGLRTVSDIRYFGHYPVADLEYTLDAPVSVGLRAWSPFLPGDSIASAMPAAVFEFHLRNPTAQAQRGRLAFSFPGPVFEETGTNRFERREITGTFTGLNVSSPKASYALGVLGGEKCRTGGPLGGDARHWAALPDQLPQASSADAGATVAVDYSLKPGEEKVIRYALAWNAPSWKGGGYNTSPVGNEFWHMYSRFHPDPAQTGARLAAEHASLLQRVISWHEVVYGEARLPVWLRDSLVNTLYHITETGHWAQNKGALAWVMPDDGLWAMNESPRECSQIECIPCTFYGNLPIVYFFPDLARSNLRGYKRYQYADGAAPFMWGGGIFGAPPADLAVPGRGYQDVLNGFCLVEIINKLWLASGDREILREFYEPAKATTQWTMNLRPDYGLKQVIAMPAGDKDSEWYESVPLFGLNSHVGGIRLAQLRMVRRMAEAMGDDGFIRQCDVWLDAGSKSLEEDLWAGTHYKLFNQPEAKRESDIILAYQLDGEWIARFHGLPGVFRRDRVGTTLDTIARFNANPAERPYGALVYSGADGRPPNYNLAYWSSNGTHSPGNFMLGMLYLYEGRTDFGLNLIRGSMEAITLKMGRTWDSPIVFDAKTADKMYGADYYQNMMLWSVPAALAGTDLTGPLQKDGLIPRMIKAAAR